jgi:hypothetical protein
VLLEDGKLPVLLLLTTLVMQAQNGLVHHSGEMEDMVDLFQSHPAELVLQRYGDFRPSAVVASCSPFP